MDIVLLSTADWDNPFWTNKQHMAVELSLNGHRVLYLESLGLRRPALRGADLRRLWRRVTKLGKKPREVRPGLWVWSPPTVPFQGLRIVRAFNRFLLLITLRHWMRRLRLHPDMLWTYNPMTTRFLRLGKFGSSVYHCVDEIKAQPGMPREEIEFAESELLRAVDVCFVTSTHLLETRRSLNRNVHLLENVADFSHFSKAMESSTQVPSDLARIAAPRIGYVGAISGYKLDLALVEAVARSRPEWSIVLIGKVGEGDPWTDVSRLEQIPNVFFLGPKDYKDLPSYLKGLDVAILPSMLNDYTRGMFPMKFFEYLAAGKPIVSTDLHALRAYSNVAMLAKTREEFVSFCEAALEGKAVPLPTRLAVAKENTYETRTKKMLEILGRSKEGEGVDA